MLNCYYDSTMLIQKKKKQKMPRENTTYWSSNKMEELLPGAMLVLAELYNMVDQVPELEVGIAAVPAHNSHSSSWPH